MKKNLSPLFLEMIIMILIFALCAGICLQVFAGAKDMSDASRTLSAAEMLAASAAETCRAADYDAAKAAEMLGAALENHGFTLICDQNMNPTAEGPYTLRMEQLGESAVFTVEYRGETVFALEAGVLIHA